MRNFFIAVEYTNVLSTEENYRQQSTQRLNPKYQSYVLVVPLFHLDK